MMEEEIRLLYAEDDADFACLTQEELKRSGFRVELARNGEQVWTSFLRDKPHILLLDLDMPGKNGLEVLKLVKSRIPDFPVVIYSAYAETTTVVKAIEAGVMDYFSKDSDFRILIAKLRSIYKRCYTVEGKPEVYHLSDKTFFHFRTGVLCIAGKTVKLKPMETTLLRLFCVKLNEWTDSGYLAVGMWGIPDKAEDLRRYILRLRKILADDVSLCLENKWGGFYRFCNRNF